MLYEKILQDSFKVKIVCGHTNAYNKYDVQLLLHPSNHTFQELKK